MNQRQFVSMNRHETFANLAAPESALLDPLSTIIDAHFARKIRIEFPRLLR